jgi:hypothetical protein
MEKSASKYIMSSTFLTGAPLEVVKLRRRQPGNQSVKPTRPIREEQDEDKEKYI